MRRLGVDVGGTFNDFVLLANERLSYWKELGESNRGAQLAKTVDLQSSTSEPLAEFVHGSTIAINALLERKHSAPALITTAGFEDVLGLRRQRRPDLYRQWIQPSPPLVPRELTYGLHERVDATGNVLEGVDDAELDALVAELPRHVSSVAVCLLHAYANPEHEKRVEQTFTRLRPDIEVVLSSTNAAEIREFERTATVVADAYLRPILAAYFTGLEDSLQSRSSIGSRWVMHSAGGRTPFENAVRFPTSTLQSGPAAGVVGATLIARQEGFDNLITLDVGGTSADVALVRDGSPVLVYDREVNDMPVLGPTIDIHSIGAGGGSLITADAGGLLHVGPQSAGAVPGPAAYGLGGTEPTLTDAEVLLGLLPASHPLAGGRLALSRDLAEVAFTELSKRLYEEPIVIAAAAVEIATASMVNAIRLVSVERGYDPREYVLVAFGGGGPLLAAEVASRLGSPAVLFPFAPGVLSAYGLLAAPTRVDASRTVMAAQDEIDVVLHAIDQLRAQLLELLPPDDRSEASTDLTVDMRYVGQNWQVPVHVVGSISPVSLRAAFEGSYKSRYGVTLDRPVQYVTVRVALYVKASAVPQFEASIPTDVEPEIGITYMESRWIDVRIWDGGIEGSVSGPALVCLKDATIAVPPGTTLTTGHAGYVLRRGSGS